MADKASYSMEYKISIDISRFKKAVESMPGLIKAAFSQIANTEIKIPDITKPIKKALDPKNMPSFITKAYIDKNVKTLQLGFQKGKSDLNNYAKYIKNKAVSISKYPIAIRTTTLPSTNVLKPQPQSNIIDVKVIKSSVTALAENYKRLGYEGAKVIKGFKLLGYTGSQAGKKITNLGKSGNAVGNILKGLTKRINTTALSISGAGKKSEEYINSLTKLGGLGKKVEFFARSFVTAFGSMELVLKNSINAFNNFQQELVNTSTVANSTAYEFDLLGAKALMIGQKTIYTATEVAKAMYFLASSGFTTKEILSSVNGVVQLGAATQSSLSKAAEVSVNILRAFNLDAKETDRIVNTLAASISSSQATLEKLSASFRYIGSTASAVGIKFEEVAAALDIMFNAGIRGSQAGVILRQAVSKLSKPTEDMIKALHQMGLTASDVNPAIHSLSDIIGKFSEANFTAKDAVTLFGLRGMSGMLAVIKAGQKTFDDHLKTISNTQTAYLNAAAQMNTTKGQLIKLTSAFETFKIKIGDSITGIIKWVALVGTSVLKFISKNTLLAEVLRSTIAVFFGIIPVIKLVMIGVTKLGLANIFLKGTYSKLFLAAKSLISTLVLSIRALFTARVSTQQLSVSVGVLGKSLKAIGGIGIAGIILAVVSGIIALYHYIKRTNQAVKDAAKNVAKLKVEMAELVDTNNEQNDAIKHLITNAKDFNNAIEKLSTVKSFKEIDELISKRDKLVGLISKLKGKYNDLNVAVDKNGKITSNLNVILKKNIELENEKYLQKQVELYKILGKQVNTYSNELFKVVSKLPSQMYTKAVSDAVGATNDLNFAMGQSAAGLKRGDISNSIGIGEKAAKAYKAMQGYLTDAINNGTEANVKDAEQRLRLLKSILANYSKALFDTKDLKVIFSNYNLILNHAAPEISSNLKLLNQNLMANGINIEDFIGTPENADKAFGKLIVEIKKNMEKLQNNITTTTDVKLIKEYQGQLLNYANILKFLKTTTQGLDVKSRDALFNLTKLEDTLNDRLKRRKMFISNATKAQIEYADKVRKMNNEVLPDQLSSYFKLVAEIGSEKEELNGVIKSVKEKIKLTGDSQTANSELLDKLIAQRNEYNKIADIKLKLASARGELDIATKLSKINLSILKNKLDIKNNDADDLEYLKAKYEWENKINKLKLKVADAEIASMKNRLNLDKNTINNIDTQIKDNKKLISNGVKAQNDELAALKKIKKIRDEINNNQAAFKSREAAQAAQASLDVAQKEYEIAKSKNVIDVESLKSINNLLKNKKNRLDDSQKSIQAEINLKEEEKLAYENILNINNDINEKIKKQQELVDKLTASIAKQNADESGSYIDKLKYAKIIDAQNKASWNIKKTNLKDEITSLKKQQKAATNPTVKKSYTELINLKGKELKLHHEINTADKVRVKQYDKIKKAIYDSISSLTSAVPYFNKISNLMSSMVFGILGNTDKIKAKFMKLFEGDTIKKFGSEVWKVTKLIGKGFAIAGKSVYKYFNGKYWIDNLQSVIEFTTKASSYLKKHMIPKGIKFTIPLKDIGKAARAVGKTLWDGIKKIPDVLWSGVKAFSKISLKGLKFDAKAIGPALKSSFMMASKVLFSIAGKFAGLLTSGLSGFDLTDKMNDMTANMINLVKNIAKSLPQIIDGMVQNIPLIISAIVNAIPVIVNALATKLPGLLVMLAKQIPILIVALINAIPPLVIALVNAIPDILMALVNGLPMVIKAIVEAIPKIVVAIVKAIPKIVMALLKAVGIVFKLLIYLWLKMWQSIINGFIKLINKIPFVHVKKKHFADDYYKKYLSDLDTAAEKQDKVIYSTKLLSKEYKNVDAAIKAGKDSVISVIDGQKIQLKMTDEQRMASARNALEELSHNKTIVGKSKEYAAEQAVFAKEQILAAAKRNGAQQEYLDKIQNEIDLKKKALATIEETTIKDNLSLLKKVSGQNSDAYKKELKKYITYLKNKAKLYKKGTDEWVKIQSELYDKEQELMNNSSENAYKRIVGVKNMVKQAIEGVNAVTQARLQAANLVTAPTVDISGIVSGSALASRTTTTSTYNNNISFNIDGDITDKNKQQLINAVQKALDERYTSGG